MDASYVDSVGIDPSKVDPVGTDPSKVDPVGKDPSKVDPVGMDAVGPLDEPVILVVSIDAKPVVPEAVISSFAIVTVATVGAVVPGSMVVPPAALICSLSA